MALDSLWNGPPLPPGEIVSSEIQTEERSMKIAVLGVAAPIILVGCSQLRGTTSV